MKTIPETGNCQRKCTLSFWRQSADDNGDVDEDEDESDAVAKYLQQSMSSCTNNKCYNKEAGRTRKKEPRHFGQTPSQSLAASAGAAVAVAASASAAAAAGAAFMPLNKNICHLLLAFWLNAKLNEVDLHISLPAFAFKYTWQLLPSLSLSLPSVSLGMCRIRLSVEFSCSVCVPVCVYLQLLRKITF